VCQGPNRGLSLQGRLCSVSLCAQLRSSIIYARLAVLRWSATLAQTDDTDDAASTAADAAAARKSKERQRWQDIGVWRLLTAVVD
jgi:hypothetical protein